MSGDWLFWGLLLVGLWLLRRRLMAAVWGLAPVVVLLVVLYLLFTGEGQQLLNHFG